MPVEILIMTLNIPRLKKLFRLQNFFQKILSLASRGVKWHNSFQLTCIAQHDLHSHANELTFRQLKTGWVRFSLRTWSAQLWATPLKSLGMWDTDLLWWWDMSNGLPDFPVNLTWIRVSVCCYLGKGQVSIPWLYIESKDSRNCPRKKFKQNSSNAKLQFANNPAKEKVESNHNMILL